MDLRVCWQKHSLSIILGIAVVVMFAISWPLGKAAWQEEYGPYWQFWLAETVVALKVHCLAVFSLVILTKYFRESGSKESL